MYPEYDQINANTGMYSPVSQTTRVDEYGNAIPFDHASRLLDKLFGAVEVKLDNYASEEKIQDARNRLMYGGVNTQVGLTNWFGNNVNLILNVALLSFVAFVALKFVRR